jgi:hypothetical protein
MILVAVFGAAVTVAVVIATSTSSTVIHARNVVSNDVHSVIKSLQDLINGNKK